VRDPIGTTSSDARYPQARRLWWTNRICGPWRKCSERVGFTTRARSRVRKKTGHTPSTSHRALHFPATNLLIFVVSQVARHGRHRATGGRQEFLLRLGPKGRPACPADDDVVAAPDGTSKFNWFGLQAPTHAPLHLPVELLTLQSVPIHASSTDHPAFAPHVLHSLTVAFRPGRRTTKTSSQHTYRQHRTRNHFTSKPFILRDRSALPRPIKSSM
jgi:hypothetical protein